MVQARTADESEQRMPGVTAAEATCTRWRYRSMRYGLPLWKATLLLAVRRVINNRSAQPAVHKCSEGITKHSAGSKTILLTKCSLLGGGGGGVKKKFHQLWVNWGLQTTQPN